MPPIHRPAPGNVGRDMSCRKCRYNLRGLPFDGQCPECGTAIALSVKKDLLRFSDPEFVQTLRKGTLLLLWGIRALVIATVGAAAFMATGALQMSLAVQVLFFLCVLPAVIGLWLLTTPDPSGLGDAQYGTPRKIVRLALAAEMLKQFIAFYEQNAGAHSPRVKAACATLQTAISFLLLVGIAANLVYLKRLAMRIPDRKLSDRVNFPLAGLIISRALSLIIVWFVPWFPRPHRRLAPASPFAFVTYLPISFQIAMLLFAVMYLYLLGSFESALQEQAALGREIWAGTEKR